MRLNVSLQLKVPGNVGHATISQKLPDFEYGGRIIRFASPSLVDVSYVYDGNLLSVHGKFAAELISECARCSETFNEPLSFEFHEQFKREVSEDELGELYPYSGDTIDIDAMLHDNILLNLPISSICQENCLGKCPQCGCNLNNTQCSCAPQEEAPKTDGDTYYPFAGLMDLLTDNEEEV